MDELESLAKRYVNGTQYEKEAVMSIVKRESLDLDIFNTLVRIEDCKQHLYKRNNASFRVYGD